MPAPAAGMETGMLSCTCVSGGITAIGTDSGSVHEGQHKGHDVCMLSSPRQGYKRHANKIWGLVRGADKDVVH